MKFSLTAISKDGTQYTEVLEAPDRFAAYRDVRARGDRVVEMTEKRQSTISSLLFLNRAFSGISNDEKIILARNLAAMLEAGLTISRALAVVERQTGNAHLKDVMRALEADVKKGSTFSAAIGAFEGVFSPLFISMTRAGEESGKLADSLRVVAVQMERASSLKKQIKGALIYPAVVVIAIIIIGILMLVYVVPTLSGTFAQLGTALPPTTQFLVSASALLSGFPILSFGTIALVFLLFAFFFNTRTGQRFLDRLALLVPGVADLSIETNSARTARTLASLLSAGVDVIFALTITRDVVGNHYFKEVLSEAEVFVTKGEPISKAFADHPKLYPPLLAEMIAVGEETGRLPQLLRETAEFYESSVEQKTKNLSSVIEPLLILFVGAMVGFFAVSMIAPIYSLSSSIS